jgi:HlyD family secretion protein
MKENERDPNMVKASDGIRAARPAPVLPPSTGGVRGGSTPARKTPTSIPSIAATPAHPALESIPARKPAMSAPAPVKRPATAALPNVPKMQPSAKPARTKLVKFSVLFIALCIMAGALIVYTNPGGAVPIPAHAPAASAHVSAAAPGLVEAESGLLRLAFNAGGKIRKVCVAEGQTVDKGQLLAELENDDSVARVDLAKASLKQAQNDAQALEGDLDGAYKRSSHEIDRSAADVALLKAGPRREEIARAKAEALAAQADAHRAAEDAEKYSNAEGMKSGAWSVQVRDNSRRAAEGAKARADAAAEVLRALENGSRKEDIARAEASLGVASSERQRIEATRMFRIQSAREQSAGAQAHLAEAEAQLEKTRLRAPIAGKVVWKYHSGGETVNNLAPDPILALADCAHLRVRAEVDEADLGSVKTGQNVRVTADSCPGHAFRGRVTQIGSSAGQKKFSTGETREKMDVNVIEVLVQLEQPGALKLGARVTAYFETAKEK